jgi:RNA polymerase sigma-70 factor (ECF subfamily)
MVSCAENAADCHREHDFGSRIALPDARLVEWSMKGDEEAFRVLYDRYRRRVFATVRRIVKNREEAQDVTQEVFAKLYRSLSRWDSGRAKFSTWLFRLASNHAIDAWRSSRHRIELSLEGEGMDGRPGRPLQYHNKMIFHAERVLERKERIAEIRRFVNGLPPLQRRVFFLRHFQGFKLNEIAESEGHKLATVKTSLYRATQHLRRRLQSLNGFGETDLMAAT